MEKLIEFCLKNRLLLLVLGLVVLASGFYSYLQLPVDAFPDVTPALVQVFTETEGLAPEEIEQYVTYPVEVAMNGMPNLKEIRSVSNFGLSVVNIYFEDGTDTYFARQLVNERLQLARGEIPEGFGEPEMGPISTGLGQILFYVLEDETRKRTLYELRTIQDWLIKFNLQTVPGVTEVLSIGGHVKQFHILIRPQDLLKYNLAVPEILHAVKANNANVGAQFIVKNAEEYIVRSVGLAKNSEDLKNIVLKSVDGTPVFLKDIADVNIGGEVRRGLTTMNGNGEVIVGMVLKLIGTNTSKVIADVKQRMKEINKSLPSGVKVVPYYDQATLVAKCVKTVTKALYEAGILIIFIMLVMLGAFRPSLVVLLSIPFSLSFSFLLMKYFGVSANLMSFGGLAIAIGLVVDGPVVMVENVDRRLKEADHDEPLLHMIASACKEVIRPIVFSLIIIIIVFVPLLTLKGVEGKTFRPLAQTIAFAMFGSLLYTVGLVPVLSSLFMKKPNSSSSEHKEFIVVRFLLAVYKPIVSVFVRKPSIAIGLAATILLLGGILFKQLGSEFVPRLDEGDLLIRATMAPSISLDEARDTMSKFEKKLMKKFPEVTRVVTRVGRGEIGAHADPVNNAEIFVRLKPKSKWKTAKTLDELYARMGEEFENFPGVLFNFTQPIAAAVDELVSGTRAELALKLFGADMEILKEKASEIENVMRSIPGAADVQKDQIAGTPQLRITLDKKALSRYGINVEDVQEIIKTAIGGEQAGQIFEGIRRFDILVRFADNYRNNKDVISQILVPAQGNIQVPLSDLAHIEEIVGPRQITRENAQRFITVQGNVRGRDIGTFVKDAESAIKEKVKLPPGYWIDWGGQFKLQREANKRLSIVVPVTLFFVFLLLFNSFNSLKNCFLILLNIPLALVGGIVALFITGQNLSVPASVGFIALFGIALANGMVLVTYLNQLLEEGIPMEETCIRGACLRVRPVLMTATAAALGLVPMILSHGTGSEVQKPLATVVIGGLVTSTALTLLVIPAIYKWFAIEIEKEKEEVNS